MLEHEIWITAQFNHYLAGMGNAALALVGLHAENPAKPWANYITVQFLVALLMVAVFAYLKPRLSVDRPGKLQHGFEVIYDFLCGQAEEVVGHNGTRYVAFFGTIFLFVLTCNLIGIIPAFEAPTMSPPVPLGCAVAVFLYYNLMGMKAQGVGKYLAQFTGPVPAMAPLMLPIEIISHSARLLSLTVRLYANMYAGEQVTLVFLGLTYLVAPALFMGLHVFVSFLQAFVFALLTMIYVSGAVSEEH
jgi:F-type H+-transporting ATPase subunit a